jgi:undecaprenyl diphosphate synthase
MPTINHVAIIMDGNGRWAKARHRPRIWGHVRGASIVSSIVEEADELNLKALTLYAFSTENWARPLDEIKFLFKLLKKFLIKEEEKIIKNNIVFKVMGNLEGLPVETLNHIKSVEQKTSNNSGLKLTFAFGYGSRNEIVDAVNSFISKNPGVTFTKEALQENLYYPTLGDVDLLIRTGGDHRVSNFLLWQIAYAELYFSETKWPDFTTSEFRSIIQEIQNKERRFGMISSGVSGINESEKIANKNKIQVVSY